MMFHNVNALSIGFNMDRTLPLQMKGYLATRRTLLKIHLIFIIGILYEFYVGLNVVSRPVASLGALTGAAC